MYGLSFNCFVTVGGKPFSEDHPDIIIGGVNHSVGGADDDGCNIAATSDSVERLVKYVTEDECDDEYVPTYEHEYIGCPVDDMGGKVVCVMVDRSEPDYVLAVIFENPEQVPHI